MWFGMSGLQPAAQYTSIIIIITCDQYSSCCFNSVARINDLPCFCDEYVCEVILKIRALLLVVPTEHQQIHKGASIGLYWLRCADGTRAFILCW